MQNAKAHINSALLTQSDCLDIIGADLSKFQYWFLRGLFKAKIENPGRGRAHLFDKKGLFYMALIDTFDKAGFDLEMISATLKENEIWLQDAAEDFAKSLYVNDLKTLPKKSSSVVYLWRGPSTYGMDLNTENISAKKLRGKTIRKNSFPQDVEPTIITIVWLWEHLRRVEYKLIKLVQCRIKRRYLTAKKKGGPKEWMSPDVEALLAELEKFI